MSEKWQRDKLIAQRNVLFHRFLSNPIDVHLAVEIKAIDDQIAEITERNRTEDRKAELRERSRIPLDESCSGIKRAAKTVHDIASKHVVPKS